MANAPDRAVFSMTGSTATVALLVCAQSAGSAGGGHAGGGDALGGVGALGGLAVRAWVANVGDSEALVVALDSTASARAARHGALGGRDGGDDDDGDGGGGDGDESDGSNGSDGNVSASVHGWQRVTAVHRGHVRSEERRVAAIADEVLTRGEVALARGLVAGAGAGGEDSAADNDAGTAACNEASSDPASWAVDEGGKVAGMIEVSRALGDCMLHPPLSAVPAVAELTLQRGGSYALVIASDGLWDVLPKAQVAG